MVWKGSNRCKNISRKLDGYNDDLTININIAKKRKKGKTKITAEAVGAWDGDRERLQGFTRVVPVRRDAQAVARSVMHPERDGVFPWIGETSVHAVHAAELVDEGKGVDESIGGNESGPVVSPLDLAVPGLCSE